MKLDSIISTFLFSIPKLFLALFFLCLLFSNNAFSEVFPVKTYTTADGLPNNSVYKILQDSRGFVWIATSDGIARFDGYDFTIFSLPNGIPSKRINDIIQAKDGTFWIGTQAGLVHFNPEGFPHEKSISNIEALELSAIPMFITYTPEGDETAKHVTKVLEDSFGNLWVGTLRGLFKLDVNLKSANFQSVEIGLPAEMNDGRVVSEIFEDSFNTLWIGTLSGLFRRWKDGETQLFTEPNSFYPHNSYRKIYQESENKLLVGTSHEGLLELKFDSSKTQPEIVRKFKQKDNVFIDSISDIEKISENIFWITTNNGIASFNSKENTIRVVKTSGGIRFRNATCLFKSPTGTIWIGWKQLGISEVISNEWTFYGEKERIETIRSVFTQNDGKPGFVGFLNLGITKNAPEDASYYWQMGNFDGDSFTWGRPKLPKDLGEFGWGDKQISFQAKNGEWWIATDKGLYRFPPAEGIAKLANTNPKSVYNRQNGLVPEGVFRLFEDSKGDIWISTNAGSVNNIYRWEKATEKLQAVSKIAGFLFDTSKIFTAFREDKFGNIWIGTNQSSLWRFKDGIFQLFTEADGVPKGWVKDLLLDQKGRLWIASTIGGASRIDEPNSEQPAFINYKQANGLSSNNVSCLVEDQAGFVYFVTDKGIDRLEVETGKIKHFSTAQGVPRDEFKVAHRDNQGNLWFGMASGLLRYQPQANVPAGISKILITALEIEGKL
jgi:ligand-binding sensor domain-containing protein